MTTTLAKEKCFYFTQLEFTQRMVLCLYFGICFHDKYRHLSVLMQQSMRFGATLDATNEFGRNRRHKWCLETPPRVLASNSQNSGDLSRKEKFGEIKKEYVFRYSRLRVGGHPEALSPGYRENRVQQTRCATCTRPRVKISSFWQCP